MIEVVLIVEGGERVPAKLALPPLPYTYIRHGAKRYIVCSYEQNTMTGTVPVVILGKEVYT